MLSPTPYDKKHYMTAYNLIGGLGVLKSELDSTHRPYGALALIQGLIVNGCAIALWPELYERENSLPYRDKDYPSTNTNEYKKLITRKYRLDRLKKRLELWETRANQLIDYLRKKSKKIREEQKRKKKKNIRNRSLSVKPLTSIQSKVMASYIQEQGNISAVAKALNKDRKTIREHMERVFEKLPHLAKEYSKPKIKPKFQKLPEDGRGQSLVTDDSEL